MTKMSPLWLMVTLVLLVERTRSAIPFLYTVPGSDDKEASAIENNTFGPEVVVGGVNNELEEETEEAVTNLLRCLSDLDHEIDAQESADQHLEHVEPGQPMVRVETENDESSVEDCSLRQFFSEFSWDSDNDEDVEIEVWPSTSSGSGGREPGVDFERKRQYSEAFAAVHNFSEFLDSHFKNVQRDQTDGSNYGMVGVDATDLTAEVNEGMDRKWGDVFKVLSNAIDALNSVTSQTDTMDQPQTSDPTMQPAIPEDETWNELFRILDDVHQTLDEITSSRRRSSAPPPPKQTKIVLPNQADINVIVETASSVLQDVVVTARTMTGNPWSTLDLLKDVFFNAKSAALTISVYGLGAIVNR